jgi:predicted transcriptional regulator
MPTFTERSTNDLPTAVLQLAPRERQVATLVYRHHALTAVELSRHLNWPRSHGALRVMRQRLVAKGILTRRHSGYGKTFLYVPAIATQDTAELAFTRLAEDFYGGSFLAAADAIQALLNRPGMPFAGSASIS